MNLSDAPYSTLFSSILFGKARKVTPCSERSPHAQKCAYQVSLRCDTPHEHEVLQMCTLLLYASANAPATVINFSNPFSERIYREEYFMFKRTCRKGGVIHLDTTKCLFRHLPALRFVATLFDTSVVSVDSRAVHWSVTIFTSRKLFRGFKCNN